MSAATDCRDQRLIRAEILPVCQHCGQDIPRRAQPSRRGGFEAMSDYLKRKFCSVACKVEASRSTTPRPRPERPNLAASLAQERARTRRLALIEDLEWIISSDSPEHVAHRLGYGKPEHLARVLHRWGRDDLASRLERAS